MLLLRQAAWRLARAPTSPVLPAACNGRQCPCWASRAHSSVGASSSSAGSSSSSQVFGGSAQLQGWGRGRLLQAAAALADEALAGLDDAPAEAGPAERQPPPRKKRGIGSLQAVPTVSPADEHLTSAIKRARKVTPASHIKNEAEKERNRTARAMDTLMKELTVPLTKYINGCPQPDRLHPFERALLQLTVGENRYVSTLTKVNNLRKQVQELGKSLAGRAAKVPSKAAAVQLAEEGYASLQASFSSGARHIDDLKSICKSLRALPYADPALPVLALVGAPNVGKSSLVRELSSGTPEVQNYPFTTRSIKVGHFFVDGRRHQVTDTPGVLSRPDDDRNKMELLTLATLEYLPSSVIFVMDLTEECGTSVEEQGAIRRELRARFATKPWVDVFSKADELDAVREAAAALQQQEAAGSAGSAPAVAPAPGLKPAAVRLAAELPHAVWVTTYTEEGTDELRAAILSVLASAAHQEQVAPAGLQPAAQPQQ